MLAPDRQPDQVPHGSGERASRGRTKKSSKQSKKASLKDARSVRELLEMNDWNPFARVDGSILEKLHKQQLLNETGEAKW
jgi:hypothetical protein